MTHNAETFFRDVAQGLTRVQTPADVIGVEHVMKLEGRSADQIVRFVSHQLRHPGKWKKKAGKQGEGKHSESHHLKYSSASWQGGGVPVLPALAVCEAQVHGVAGEEGPGVQGELHAGRVGDGLAQQSHHPGTRR